MTILNGWYITGFTDGEGCFSLFTDHKGNNGRACFHIKLRSDDLAILENIKLYFQCGDIWSSSSINKNPCTSFQVRKLDDLIEKVIPHFEEFPLQAKKARDFEIWRDAVRFFNRITIMYKGRVKWSNSEREIWEDYMLRLCTQREYRGVAK